MSFIPTIAKAIAAAATAFGGAFVTAYVDEAIATSEWVTIIVATVVAAFAVWSIPNREA